MSADPQPRGRRPGLLMAKIFGVPVYVAPSWFVVAVLITLTYAPIVESQVPGIGAGRYPAALAFAVLLYLSVLVHEISHSLTALRLGLGVRRIVLHLLGGVSEIEPARRPGGEFLVAAAGPALSLLLGLAGLLLVDLTTPATVLRLLVTQLTLANLLVAGFNLLPGLPLDGGRMLSAAVWAVTGRAGTGVRVAGWTGRILAVALVGVPLAMMLRSGNYQLSGASAIWTLLLALFIFEGANAALVSARVTDRLPELVAVRFAQPCLLVPPDLPLAETVRRATESGALAVVVADAGGHPLGVVHADAATAVPEHRRAWVATADVAQRVGPETVVPAGLAGDELLARAEQAGGGTGAQLVVVDEQGRAVGVIDVAALSRWLTGPAARGRAGGRGRP